MLQLVYRDGEGERVVIRLEAGATVTVGRNPGSTIRTDNPSVSREHAEILEDGQGAWVVEDLRSSNHTYLNEDPVQEGALKAGDVLRFGDFRVKVQGRVRPPPSEEVAAVDGEEAEADPRKRRRGEERKRKDALEAKREARTARRTQAAESDDPPPPTLQKEDPTAGPEASTTPVAEPAAPESPEPEPVEVVEPEPVEVVEPEIEDRAGDTAADLELPGALVPQVAARPAEPEGEEQLFDLGRRREREDTGQEQALLDREARIQELELRCRELELREQRHDEELDGWHERYTRVKTRVEHAERLAEDLGGESVDLREKLEEAQERSEALEAQVVQMESAGGAGDGQMTHVKLQVVQRDRRIDDLERELDMMEYDLRAGRDELEALQESFNQDNRDQRKLSREMELLREVITDKENVVGGLKKQIEDAEREIYDLKLGTGIKDLEDARQDVMDRFFAKSREVDEFTEKLAEAHRHGGTQQGMIEELEKRLEEKKDISNHPTHKRRLRELDRTKKEMKALQADLKEIQDGLDEFGPETRSKLDAELNFLQRKNQGLDDKLKEAKATIDRLRKAKSEDESDETGDQEDGAEVSPRSLSAGVNKMLDAMGQSQGRLQRLRQIVREGRSREQGVDAGELDEMAELLALLRAEVAGVRRILHGLREEVSNS